MIKRRRKPRRGRVIDKEYLAWIHTQQCVVGQRSKNAICIGPIEAHHVRTLGSLKNDHRTLPLCRGHHTGLFSIHNLGRQHFTERYGIDFEIEIATLNAKYSVDSEVGVL